VYVMLVGVILLANTLEKDGELIITDGILIKELIIIYAIPVIVV